MFRFPIYVEYNSYIENLWPYYLFVVGFTFFLLFFFGPTCALVQFRPSGSGPLCHCYAFFCKTVIYFSFCHAQMINPTHVL